MEYLFVRHHCACPNILQMLDVELLRALHGVDIVLVTGTN
jgi:hypothetical protein